MGSKSIISNAYLEDIGDAIRQKRGTEETYYPSQMGDAIRGIEGIVPSGTINIDTDGTYDVTQYAEAVVETGIEELRQEYESAVEISGCDPLSEGLETLLTDANTTTGNADTTLSDAVGTLISGYGDYLLDDIASGTEPSGDIVINSKSIRTGCFWDCLGLTSVTFEGTESIGNNAFYGCTNLTSVYGKNVITINSQAFMNCFKLTDIKMPKLQTIGSTAFRTLQNLTFIALPAAINVGANAFFGCVALRDIYLPNDAATYTGAPWGAANATIHYNTVFNENGEPII